MQLSNICAFCFISRCECFWDSVLCSCLPRPYQNVRMFIARCETLGYLSHSHFFILSCNFSYYISAARIAHKTFYVRISVKKMNLNNGSSTDKSFTEVYFFKSKLNINLEIFIQYWYFPVFISNIQCQVLSQNSIFIHDLHNLHLHYSTIMFYF